MKFKVLDPKDNVEAKCTIHMSGKLGFSAGAAIRLDLESIRNFKVAVNAEDEKDDSLYLKVSEEIDLKAFTVLKAGKYFSLNLKHIFDQMGLKYREETISFLVKKIMNDDKEYFKLERERKED